MIIEKEQEFVKAGDAIFVPSNKKHGIKNIGNESLKYLTANYPAFDENYENVLWPSKP
jgi:mannose-6-phosphate isomerase-like protein (cupin superfamily)